LQNAYNNTKFMISYETYSYYQYIKRHHQMSKILLQEGTNPEYSGLLPIAIISAKNYRQSPFFKLLQNANIN